MDSSRPEQWRNNLIRGLFDSEAVVSEVLSRFAESEDLGLAYAESESLGYWAANMPKATEFAHAFGANCLPWVPDFPQGGMFWARTAMLERIFSSTFLDKILLTEPIASDGTYLHAFERMLPYLSAKEGFRMSKIRVT